MAGGVDDERPPRPARLAKEVRQVGCTDETLFPLALAHSLVKRWGEFKSLQVVTFDVCTVLPELVISPGHGETNETVVGRDHAESPAGARIKIGALRGYAAPVCVTPASKPAVAWCCIQAALVLCLLNSPGKITHAFCQDFYLSSFMNPVSFLRRPSSARAISKICT
jgi:hypothetical protein